MGQATTGLLRGRKFAVLLVMLIVSLAIQSVGAKSGLEGLSADGVATVLSIAILLIVFERPRERNVMAAMLAAFLGSAWAHYFMPPVWHFGLSVTHHTFAAVFQWYAVWVILREVFRRAVIGADDVRGAICGYLISGSAWGSVNALAYLLTPSTYAIDSSVTMLLSDWHNRAALFTFYSFTQMLSIGYADVTPLRAPATTLSLLATLFGLFYTAVVISQLVNMAQSRRTPPGEGA